MSGANSIRSRWDWTPAGSPGTFLMDTSLTGNSNAGHSFENGPRGNGIIGPLLTDEQRWALVEYLKSIPEEGRPRHPVRRPAGRSSPGMSRWRRQRDVSDLRETRSEIAESGNVRPCRWPAADRRSIGRSHRSVRVHQPGKSRPYGARRECFSFGGRQRDVLQRRQSFDRGSPCDCGRPRRCCEVQAGRPGISLQLPISTPSSASSGGASRSSAAPALFLTARRSVLS